MPGAGRNGQRWPAPGYRAGGGCGRWRVSSWCRRRGLAGHRFL